MIRLMSENHEKTLSAICRQLLELEVGLRKKEKELTTALLQREKVIREQNYLIRVLGKKAGAKRTDIRQLCDEAMSKIPQVEETSLSSSSPEDVKILDSRKNPFSSTVELSSIVESGSENDSDSAIMVDDERLHQQSSPEMSTTLPRSCRQIIHRHTRAISRSVSDVASATLSEELPSPSDDIEAELSPAFSSPHLCDNDVFVDDDENSAFTGFDSAHYRGFLLRHGSYERYKIRSRKKDPLDTEIKGVCTLPRTKTNDKTGVHLHVGSSDTLKARRVTLTSTCDVPTSFETKTCGKNSATVVMINTDQVK